jgi:hypothetical protein
MMRPTLPHRDDLVRGVFVGTRSAGKFPLCRCAFTDSRANFFTGSKNLLEKECTPTEFEDNSIPQIHALRLLMARRLNWQKARLASLSRRSIRDERELMERDHAARWLERIWAQKERAQSRKDERLRHVTQKSH